jgi:hypothetical protein
MKKIIFWVIVIGLLYYFRHKITALPIFDSVRNNQTLKNIFNQASNTVAEVLNEQTATAELKTWVLKDGVKLPKDWTLAEKTVGTQKVTVMVPPNPNGENDYIALAVKKENILKLPTNHTCKEMETTATCLVGNNYETLKVFSVLTFVQ